MALTSDSERRAFIGLPFIPMVPIPDGGELSDVEKARIAGFILPELDITEALLMSPARILANYIIQTMSKLSTPSESDDWPLYISHLPDAKDISTAVGAIFNTAGVLESRCMNGKVPQHHGVQIRVRSRTSEAGYIKLEDIACILDLVSCDTTITIGTLSFNLQNISRSSTIITMGIDELRRSNYAVNYLLTLRRV